MSASFRRKKNNDTQPLNANKRGTKRWTGGITLCSVGIRDLDSILGGGQPIGSCLLLEEDRWTRDSAFSLVKYWSAEAVCHEQLLLIPSFQEESSNVLSNAVPSLFDESRIHARASNIVNSKEIKNLIDSLPRNLNWDKAAGRKVIEDSVQNRPLEILEEDEEEGEDPEEGLKVAWQYRKSIQNERLGHRSTRENTTTTDVFCHSYDLNGRLKDQAMNHDCIQILDVKYPENNSERRSSGFHLFLQIKQQLDGHVKKSGGRLIRVLLYKAQIETSAIIVPLLLAYIRSNSLNVVMLVTVHAWLCQSEAALVSLRRSSDVVMQTEGFASRIHYPPPAEFRHLHGLLLLPKVSTVTTAASTGHFADMTVGKRPPSHVYGLKRDRRKLHISLLHIPPEDYAGGGGSVGGGAVRSGGGLRTEKKGGGCSRKDNDPLAF